MKNKKLFAILTLLCFMMTLMPVAAFAADAGTLTVEQDPQTGVVTMTYSKAEAVRLYSFENNAWANTGIDFVVNAEKGIATATFTPGTNVLNAHVYGVKVTDISKFESAEATGEVTPEMAKVYANASATPSTEVDASTSAFTANNGDDTYRLDAVDGSETDEYVAFTLTLRDVRKDAAKAAAGTLYIWAKDSKGNLVSGVDGITGFDASGIKNVWVNSVESGNNDPVNVTFAREGEYTFYAGIGAANANSLSDITPFKMVEPNTIKVNVPAVNPEEYNAALDNFGPKEVDSVLGTIAITPNNVMSDKHTVTFTREGKTLSAGKTVSIETNSGSVETNKTTATTNGLGQIDFKVAGSVEGDYEITVEVDGVSWTIKVQVGNTSAAYIETAKEPTAPQALFGTMKYDKIGFTITDINGNTVKAADEGMDGIVARDGKFIVLTEKPAGSNLASEDLFLDYDEVDQMWYLQGIDKDAEGTYTAKVILDNGAYATATWEVKKFGTPVELRIGSATKTVELGGKITLSLDYVDANGVEKDANDADLAASGYAVENVAKAAKKAYTVTVKTDEKYVGSKINVTAVSQKYDLVGAVELTVAEGASEIKFADKTAEVNVNNKITWNVVDAQGNKVALGDQAAKAEIKYVVLDKPEGAKVSTNDVTIQKDLRNKGEGKLALTSNKVGNVTVQVVLKATYNPTTVGEKVQVKYYTGTQIFAVGNGSVGDVVVMSIGSSEIIVNDAKATIDAAPMIQNDRTYVPFRALAEAFGAEVAYDEATQAVTAELNGVKVVMTIGSATYTVNDAEKTMDVAPFINGSRTMVPVRFAAEAFGIKVIPTYDENGATADILFNL